MGISSQRTSPKKRRERSIFGSIFNSTMLVVLVEVLLLVASIYLMRVGPQLNHNAEDILAMQVETRSRLHPVPVERCAGAFLPDQPDQHPDAGTAG